MLKNCPKYCYIESEINFSQNKELSVLGLDEISLRKNYRDFVTLISCRVDSKVHVQGVADGLEKTGLIDFLREGVFLVKPTLDIEENITTVFSEA